MGDKASSSAWVFDKVLRAFETGGFAYTDILAELNRLLETGASPTELLEILRRRELIEPLPEYAHVNVLGVLNDAIGQAAAHAAVSDEAQNAEPVPATGQIPHSVPTPIRPTPQTPPLH